MINKTTLKTTFWGLSMGLLLGGQSFGQQAQIISGDSRTEFFRSTQFTASHPSAGFVSGGQIIENGGITYDGSIVLQDDCGLTINAYEYGQGGSYQLFRQVREIEVNNPVFPSSVGYAAVGFTEQVSGQRDGFLVVTDENLQPYANNGASTTLGNYYIFDAVPAGSPLFQDDEFLAVTPLAAGGFAVAGYCSPYQNSSDQDILVVQFNADLTLAWEVHIGMPGGNDQGWGITQLNNGNLMVAGRTESLPGTGLASPILVELDVATGQIAGGGSHIYVYEDFGTSPSPSYFLDIERGPGNYLIMTGVYDAGTYYKALAMEVDYTVPSAPTHTHRIVGFSNRDQLGVAIDYDPIRDEYLMAGYTDGNNFPFGSWDGYCQPLARPGLTLATQGYYHGGTGADFDFDIDVDNQGLIVMAGRNGSFSGGGVNATSNYFLVSNYIGSTYCNEQEFLPSGSQTRYVRVSNGGATPLIGTDIITSLSYQPSNIADHVLCKDAFCKKGGDEGGLEPETDVEVSLHPNPATSHIVMSMSNAAEIRILDVQGRVLQQLPMHGDGFQKTSIQVGYLPSGIYFAEVRLNTGEIQRIKWVKK